MRVSIELTEATDLNQGISVYIKNITKHCKNIDFYAGALLAGKKYNKQQRKEFFLSNYSIKDVNIKRIFVPNKYVWFRNFMYLPGIYHNVMPKTDAYIYFYNFIPNNAPKGKSIVYIHDLTPLYNTSFSNAKKSLFRHMFSNTIKRADLVFTVSEFSKKDIIEKFPLAKDKVKVIGVGVESERFMQKVSEEEKERVTKKYNLPEKYILFVGQARENKNLVRLMKAYAQLPKEIQDKCGLVYANTNEELNKLAKELGIESKLRLLNGIDGEDLVAVYQKAHVFALVSTNEGFGIPLVEAMASGVPVICSNVSCLPEVVEDSAIKVDPYSEEAIKEGLEKIIQDEKLRKELIAKGYVQCKKFAWDKIAEKFELELEEFLNK